MDIKKYGLFPVIGSALLFTITEQVSHAEFLGCFDPYKCEIHTHEGPDSPTLPSSSRVTITEDITATSTTGYSTLPDIHELLTW